MEITCFLCSISPQSRLESHWPSQEERPSKPQPERGLSPDPEFCSLKGSKTTRKAVIHFLLQSSWVLCELHWKWSQLRGLLRGVNNQWQLGVTYATCAWAGGQGGVFRSVCPSHGQLGISGMWQFSACFPGQDSTPSTPLLPPPCLVRGECGRTDIPVSSSRFM